MELNNNAKKFLDKQENIVAEDEVVGIFLTSGFAVGGKLNRYEICTKENKVIHTLTIIGYKEGKTKISVPAQLFEMQENEFVAFAEIAEDEELLDVRILNTCEILTSEINAQKDENNDEYIFEIQNIKQEKYLFENVYKKYLFND